MLFLVAFIGAAIVALVLWKAMNTVRAELPEQSVRRPMGGVARPRVSGPDDDPEFLRQLGERVRKPEDPPKG